MTHVHVLVVDGSHWVREEDYRTPEQSLREARAALNEVHTLCGGIDYERWCKRHAAALKAAREAKA